MPKMPFDKKIKLVTILYHSILLRSYAMQPTAAIDMDAYSNQGYL